MTIEDALTYAALGLWILVLLAALMFKIRFHIWEGEGGWKRLTTPWE